MIDMVVYNSESNKFSILVYFRVLLLQLILGVILMYIPHMTEANGRYY